MTTDELQEIKHHFDVVMERIESQIRTVADGVLILAAKLDRVDSRLSSLEAEVEALRVTMSGGFDRVDARLTSLEEKLGATGRDAAASRAEGETGSP